MLSLLLPASLKRRKIKKQGEFIMKKRLFTALFGILLLFSLVFSSCNANQKMFNDLEKVDESESSYESMIKHLENQILLLQQSQNASDEENQKEITRLQNLLSQLKEQASDSSSSADSDSEAADSDTATASPSVAKFLYIQTGDTATITGYTGDDEVLVIPSKIDGFQVTAISDNAFQSQTLRNVIVADGITKIGWFAFRDCPALSSVTIPSSVSSIGYSAFASDGGQLTIYCHSNSFAQKYAQSYGISHAII